MAIELSIFFKVEKGAKPPCGLFILGPVSECLRSEDIAHVERPRQGICDWVCLIL